MPMQNYLLRGCFRNSFSEPWLIRSYQTRYHAASTAIAIRNHCMTDPSSPSTPTRNQTLENAWVRFGTYDKNAVVAQKRFVRQRKWILLLGVMATTLAVIYSVVENKLSSDAMLLSPWLTQKQFLDYFHILVVLTPIALSVMITFSVKFNLGLSWVMLRSSAEAIRKEIYCYRTQTGEYGIAQTVSESREVHLARRLKMISKRLMETPVNQTGLEAYKGNLPPIYGTAEGDDGFSDMTADDYLHYRVDDQFNYYQKKAVRLNKEHQKFQWLIIILSGVGAALAALRFDVWLAVSGALASAFTGFLEFKRVETNLIACNMTATDLYDIRVWWHALSDSIRAQQATFETLVSSTEAVLQTENAGWLQEMRDALAEIYGQKKAEEASAIKQAAGDQPPDQPLSKPLDKPTFAAPPSPATETPAAETSPAPAVQPDAIPTAEPTSSEADHAAISAEPTSGYDVPEASPSGSSDPQPAEASVEADQKAVF